MLETLAMLAITTFLGRAFSGWNAIQWSVAYKILTGSDERLLRDIALLVVKSKDRDRWEAFLLSFITRRLPPNLPPPPPQRPPDDEDE
jgi:hypothetical protein